MAKIDPKGVPSTPIKSALAHELAEPPAAEKETLPLPALENKPLLASPDKIRKSAFTSADLKANDRAVQKLAEAVGVDSIAWSSINRAVWSIVRKAVEESDELERYAPTLTRPPNGDVIGMAKFEDGLAEYISKLMKHTTKR